MIVSALTSKYRSVPAPAKAAMWFTVCNVIQKAVQMLTVPIITRMLTPTEYGVFSVFNSYSSIVIIFGTLYVYGNGYYVGMKKFSGDQDRYTSSVAGIMALCTSLLLGLFLVVRDWASSVTGMSLTEWLLMFVWMYGQGAISLWFIQNRYL